MDDELDTSIDTSSDTSCSDSFDSGGFDDSVDIGGFMDDFADVGDYSSDSSDIEILIDKPSDVGNIMDNSMEFSDLSDQPSDVINFLDNSSDIEVLMDESAELDPMADEPPVLTDYPPDIGSVVDAPSEVVNLMDEPTDVVGAIDDISDAESYHAAPNSEIPILQEDGSVESLDSIMAANGDTEAAPIDIEPYCATSNSEIPILQEDGSVETLENIMAVNADIEEPFGDCPVFENPQSDFVDESTTDSLEAIMNNSAETDNGGLEDISLGISPAVDSPGSLEGDFASVNEDIHTVGDDVVAGDTVEPVAEPIHMVQSDVEAYIESSTDSETLQQLRDGIASGRIQIDADTEFPTEYTEETFESAADISDFSQDIDYDTVYSGLDSYDFDGIDVGSDVERLDSSLESFQPETWENLTVDEQKAAMSDLADYVKDVIGFDNPPQIVYYNNPVAGDYGGYSPGTNTLEVNEYMLYDSDEAADTVAHELWHAYQHERALNPQSAKDFQYQYGFDNYIQPDVDFAAYQDQLVEAEARAFAQQLKDRLSTKRRSI